MKKILQAVIEIPQGSAVKYEFDQKQGKMKIDRLLKSGQTYPFAYGFIEKSLSLDGDPLDVLIIEENKFATGDRVDIYPIALLRMIDEHGQDDKILAVTYDKQIALTDKIKKVIADFFRSYKKMEKGKWSKLGEFLDKAAAENEIRKSLLRYRKKNNR